MKTKRRVHFKNCLALSIVLGPLLCFAQEDGDERLQKLEVQKPDLQTLTIEEIVVTAQRRRGLLDDLNREYRTVDGKRIFDGPYGDTRYILAIGQELKNRGEMKRIMSRRITMPQDFPGSSLDRYQYPIAHECGIEKFQFFHGGEFMALGYEVMDDNNRAEVIFDVLIGGGPFAAPGIWGPYDQVLGRRHRMELIMGDAQSDGMGLLKSGYAVGMKADMPGRVLRETGDVYGSAVDAAGRCLAEKINIEAARRLLSTK